MPKLESITLSIEPGSTGKEPGIAPMGLGCERGRVSSMPPTDGSGVTIVLVTTVDVRTLDTCDNHSALARSGMEVAAW